MNFYDIVISVQPIESRVIINLKQSNAEREELVNFHNKSFQYFRHRTFFIEYFCFSHVFIVLKRRARCHVKRRGEWGKPVSEGGKEVSCFIHIYRFSFFTFSHRLYGKHIFPIDFNWTFSLARSLSPTSDMKFYDFFISVLAVCCWCFFFILFDFFCRPRKKLGKLFFRENGFRTIYGVTCIDINAAITI